MQVNLDSLLPKAIVWAEAYSDLIQRNGQPLTDLETELAIRMGVANPQKIRILFGPEFPRPEDPELFSFVEQAGFYQPSMHGLTLGHGIFIRDGYRANRLISHECRHVYQYEKYGSIAAFLRDYLPQVIKLGYSQAPLEIDAYASEVDA